MVLGISLARSACPRNMGRARGYWSTSPRRRGLSGHQARRRRPRHPCRSAPHQRPQPALAPSDLSFGSPLHPGSTQGVPVGRQALPDRRRTAQATFTIAQYLRPWAMAEAPTSRTRPVSGHGLTTEPTPRDSTTNGHPSASTDAGRRARAPHRCSPRLSHARCRRRRQRKRSHPAGRRGCG